MRFIKPIYIGLLAVIVLAFSLRVYNSDTYGVYLDEKYTLVISQGIAMEGANQKDVFFTPGKTYFTPREFWKEKTIDDFIGANIRGDIGNSPSYYAILWAWINLFGLSDFSIRFPSVLFSTLLVGMIFVFVRKHFRSEQLALLSAFLMAVEPFFVAYSHMARNYSMSFFLTLLATHLFLLLLEQQQTKSRSVNLLFAYGLVFVLSLLSHYLTITVFLCHGLYALVYVRPARRWVPFLLTGALGLGLVSLWFFFGGGAYTFQTLAHQAQFYRNIALTNPYNSGYGTILPATLVNVVTRSSPIWADLFILSNGLGQTDTMGIRYIALALVFGLVAAWLLSRHHQTGSPPRWVYLLYPALLVAVLPFATAINLQYVVVATLPSFVYLLFTAVRKHLTKDQQPLLQFVILLAVVPTLFLIVMSLRNGHTYGITQRYSGFSFPFSIILIALLLQQLVRIPNALRFSLLTVLLIQGYFIIRLLDTIYQDQAPKYTYFARQRGANPYYHAAQQIKKSYTPGDTILYPSVRLYPQDNIEKTYWPYSIQDAQLTNLYLPKDANYTQRMDTTEVNKIVLLKRSGQRIVLFDLKGTTHRY